MAFRRINVTEGTERDESVVVVFDTCIEESQLYWYLGICQNGLEEMLWEFGYKVTETLLLEKDMANVVKSTSMITSLEELGASVSGTRAADNPSTWFGLVDLPRDLDLEEGMRWRAVEPEIKWDPTAEEIKTWATRKGRRSMLI